MTGKPEVMMHDPEPEDVTGTELAPWGASDAMIDVQVATAKRFPRSIAAFRKEAQAMACLDEETAGECIYAVPRSGKTIEGPSARLAEILLYSWGNARADAEVVDIGDTEVTAMGTFVDLERNVAIRKKVKRRITDKAGRPFSDDMIAVTGNAAVSIALRNTVLAGIPKAIWKGVYSEARKASLGKGATLTQQRQKMLDYYGKLGVTQEKVFALLGIGGIEDVKEDQLVTLRGLANAIKDGEATVEDVFNPRHAPTGTPDLNARVTQRQAAPKDEDAARRAEEREMVRREAAAEQATK